MSLWRQARYYCVNTAAPCRYAIGDIPFSAKDRNRFEGLCRGHDSDGCGSALVAGDPKGLRARWAFGGVIALTAAIGMGWLLRTVVFPPPLRQVSFQTAETTTDDQAGVIQLDVIREGELQREIHVDYVSADASAKAGEDYQPVRSQLVFLPGERHKSIRVAVLPDKTFRKGPRFFTLTLSNVVDRPQQIVHIALREIERTQQMQIDQAVLAASRIAADIGGFMVKHRVLLKLLTARSGSEQEAREYQQQLVEVEDNISRSREGYSQSLRDLKTFPPPAVLQAIDHLHEDLDAKHFGQQSRALQLMKAQYSELLDNKSMDMDRWAQELETAVPHVGSGNVESST